MPLQEKPYKKEKGNKSGNLQHINELYILPLQVLQNTIKQKKKFPHQKLYLIELLMREFFYDVCFDCSTLCNKAPIAPAKPLFDKNIG